MLNKILILVLCGLLSGLTGFAQTIVPGGNVSGTWTAAGSPYLVQGNITIQADSTLNIEPGVEVNFQGHYSLTVNGFLQAIGTATDSIHFTASTDWEGINFTSAPDSSHLEYCILDSAASFSAPLYCQNSNPVISHCTIRDNSGYSGSGGIQIANSNPRISHCTISNNSGTPGANGGISISASDPEIYYCTITGNYSAGGAGGGIYCEAGSTPLISHCTITGNSSKNNSGGGIAFVNGGGGTITDCFIAADSAYIKGGGIYISSYGGVVNINNSTIKNCFNYGGSGNGGGGIYIQQADTVSIMSTIIDANHTTNGGEGGAMYSVNCSNLIIDHCDVVNNSAELYEGGIYLNGNTNIIVKNSIFKDQGGYHIVFQNYSSASVTYSDFYGSFSPFHNNPPAGLGTLTQTNANGDSCDVFYNIYLDPLFVDFPNGDYHLTANSPCIDAGDPASTHDPDGTITDMGRYFFDQGGTGITGGYVSGTWTAAGSPYRILGNITIHADSILTIEPGVEVIFQGLYTFQVNGSLAAIGTEMDSISFYASDTSTGWAGIRIAATADPSSISYARIRYGRNTDGGGIYCASPNAVITHCAITDNRASNNGGGICINTGITNPPPVFNNCVISRNSARFGGGVFYVADSMVITDCVISNNAAQDPSGDTRGGGLYFDGGFSSSIYINNCTIQNNSCESDPSSGNSLHGLGGGLYIHARNGGGTFISNCQILSNWARRSGGGIFRDLGGVEISDCTIKGNSTKYCEGGSNSLLGGGAIGLSYLNFNSLISHCEISENTGRGYAGGAIRAFWEINASLTLENCTVSNNYCVFYPVAAIYTDGTLYLKNSIVTFNKSGTHSGGIFANSTNVSYCEFFNNDEPDIIGAPGGFGTLTTTNANGDSCDIYSNIFLDPLFADTTNSDYQLTWANWPVADSTKSPCIDAGDPASPYDPDNTIADMGVFYFNQLLITVSDTLLDFGIVDIGQQLDLPLTIRNGGTAALRLQNVSNQNSVFTHNWNPADSLILPGDSLTVTVTFTPVDTNLIVDTLLIENNDKPLQVQLSGKGKIVVGIADQSELPKVYALYPAYPNPFNPATHIRFDLPKSGEVQLIIYDILGRKVATLMNKKIPAGRYEVEWDAADYGSGLYFYQLKADKFNEVRKMLLVK